MTHSEEPMAMALAVIETPLTQELPLVARQWLRESLGNWILAQGLLSFEHCASLPTTHDKRRQYARDVWLMRAADYVKADSLTGAASALHKELSKFLSRGPWRHWRDDDDPPPEAARLDVALFRFAKLNGGEGLSEKQILRVLRQKFQGKCLD